jgi:hypothetical protein
MAAVGFSRLLRGDIAHQSPLCTGLATGESAAVIKSMLQERGGDYKTFKAAPLRAA